MIGKHERFIVCNVTFCGDHLSIVTRTERMDTYMNIRNNVSIKFGYNFIHVHENQEEISNQSTVMTFYRSMIIFMHSYILLHHIGFLFKVLLTNILFKFKYMN